jgi:hypothetical protein
MLSGKVATVVGAEALRRPCAQYLAYDSARVAVLDLSDDQARTGAQRIGGYGVASETCTIDRARC